MIDGGVFIDRDPTSGIGGDVDDAIARLDRFGADRALAASFKAVYFDSREGNDLTARCCAQSQGRLLPMAVVNLLGYDAGAGYLEEIRDAGFRAVALFPAFQYWSWSDYVAQKFAEQAARLEMPLQAAVWTRQDLADVARYIAPAGGPVLVRWMRGSGYNNLPDIIAIAEDHKNLVFDVSAITQSGGIERLAERVGADRLYLASNIPLTLEGAPYFMLEAARLPDHDKRMIRSGTLERVLDIQETASAETSSDIWAWMRDQAKIDTHWHTSGWNIIEPRLGLEAMAEDFDAFNYQVAISSSVRALNHDIAEGNAETLAFVETESRARGLVVINPLEVDRSIAELEKYKDDPRFVGAKTIQDFYGKELDDPGYLAIFEHLQTMLGWPVMAHLPGMKRAAEQFPKMHFVAAHSTWRYWDFAGMDNVWFDIATSTSLRSDVDLAGLLETVGEDRVIFSCDGQLMSPAWTLGKLASAGLPEAAIVKVLRKNALSAFPRLQLTVRNF